MARIESGDDIDYGAPESYFVFLVGNCEEWPENRAEQGDIALYNEYLAAGVPPDQIVFVKDRKCTKENCEKELMAFLKRTRPCSTLVFFYGGHGNPHGFNTRKAMWKYRDVTSAIENYFEGERVIYLLDCCASGNLARWLSPPCTVTKQYISLAASPPFIEASDDVPEWVMYLAWIRGMRCSDGALPLSHVIDLISDRVAVALGDQFTTYTNGGTDCTQCDWMPRRKPEDITGKMEWERLDTHVPKDGIVSSKWTIGNCVYYKHRGGPCKPGGEYIPPGWLDARILSESNGGTLELEVSYPGKSLKWIVQTQRKQLMNDFYMGKMWMIPDKFEKAQCVLARNFKYLDYSLEPDTVIKASADDGEVHAARVLDWRYFDWEGYLDSDDCSREPPYGAHVTIQWLHEEKTSLLPVRAILSPNITAHSFLDSLDSATGREESLARKALVLSIESSGKSVCNAKDEVGSPLRAFWPEDEEWYGVEPLDPNTISLKILATHANFTLQGKYCPLAYDDGDVQFSPLFYVERQRRFCCFNLM